MTETGIGAGKPRRRYGTRKNWRDVFIAKLGETSHVGTAAAEAGISMAWAYRTRREDPGFARRWFDALCEGYDNLEMDLLYRLRTGRIEELDQEGNKRKFDIATSFKCLQSHRDIMKAQKTRPLQDDGSVIASINAKIEAMRAREMEANAMLPKEDSAPSAGDDDS